MNYFTSTNFTNKKFVKKTILIFLAVLTVFSFAAFFSSGICEARAGRSGGSSSRSYSSSSSYSSYSRGYSSSSYGRSGYSGYSSSSRRSYPSSYARGYYSSSRGHFSSAIILFFTFIIIAVIGVIHFLTSKSSSGGTSFFPSSSPGFGSASSYQGAYGGSLGSSGRSYGSRSMDIADVPEAPRNDLYELKERVKEVFMRVQEAWSEREPSYAESYVSQRLFYKHQRQIEDMLHRQEKNILKNINIIDVKIVEVAGGGNGLEPDGYGGGGRMKTIIRASMIDYVIDENTGRIVDGDEYAPDEFCEQWNFVYEDDGWIADEIISGG